MTVTGQLQIGVVFITVVTGSVISAPMVWVSVVATVVVADDVAIEPPGTAAEEKVVFAAPVIANSPMLE